MSERILIITINKKLSTQIFEYLGDAGFGNISVVGESNIALEKLRGEMWSHVIIDLDFEEGNILALGQAIRDISPEVEVLFITSDGLPGVDIQIPGIAEQLVDLSNIVTAIRQKADSEIVIFDEQNISWKENREVATKCLQQYLPISSAIALILINNKNTWANAGRLSEKVIGKISDIMVKHWSENEILVKEVFRVSKTEPERDDVYLENCHDDLICYVDVGSIVGDYVLYATKLDGRFSLAFVFVSKTPLSQIRQRVRRISQALNDGEDINDINNQKEPIHANLKSNGINSKNHDEEISLMDGRLFPEDIAPPPKPMREHGLYREQYLGYIGDDREMLFPFKRARLKSRKPAVSGLVDDQMVSSSLINDDLNDEHIKKISLMKDYSPSGIWSQINYCCILIPRLPWLRIEDDLKDQLSVWMHTLGFVYNIKMKSVSALPTSLQWVCEVNSIMAPAEVIDIMRRQTSKKIFNDFPNFASDNTSGDFWASECLVVSRGELLDDAKVHTFVQIVRKRQGVVL